MPMNQVHVTTRCPSAGRTESSALTVPTPRIRQRMVDWLSCDQPASRAALLATSASRSVTRRVVTRQWRPPTTRNQDNKYSDSAANARPTTGPHPYEVRAGPAGAVPRNGLDDAG